MPKFINLKLPRRYLLLILIVLAFVAVGGIWYFSQLKEAKLSGRYLWNKARQEALTTKGKFPQEQVVAKAGEENLYGRDLNYKLFIYFPEVLASEEDVPKKIKDEVLVQVIEESVILQTAEKLKLISLNGAVFNNPNKDYSKRNELINKARDELPSQVVEQIDFEAISIWFYNTDPPEMGVKKAKGITYAKMTAIYEEIKGGKISFKEAGERIASDTELEEIDFAYQTNAYSTFTEVEKGTPIFHDPELEKVLWTLKEGEISSILTGRDFAAEGRAYEAFFVVLKVNRRNFTGFSSFNDWLEAEKKKYEIKILL